jgi:hypothetical protein
LTIFISISDLVTVLAVASAGHFELRAAILAGDRRERDFFRAHRAFLSCFVHYLLLTAGFGFYPDPKL